MHSLAAELTLRRGRERPPVPQYPDDLKHPDPEKWEALARKQGYFPVLTHDGVLQVAGNDVATLEFLATGEADVASLLAQTVAIVGPEVSLASVLDFGCGVGRLTLPLAQRAKNVTACDIAPTMLGHARRNAEEAALHNIRYVSSEQLLALPDHSFTFICSLLVFQYIPRQTGYGLIRSLLRLLSPGGVAVLHVLLAPRGEALRQLARMSQARSRFNGSAGDDRSATPCDDMQMYEYDEGVVVRAIEAAGAHVMGRLAANAGATTGTVFIIRKALDAI